MGLRRIRHPRRRTRARALTSLLGGLWSHVTWMCHSPKWLRGVRWLTVLRHQYQCVYLVTDKLGATP